MIRAGVGRRWRAPAISGRRTDPAGVAAVFADQDAPVTRRERHRIRRIIPVRSEIVVKTASVGVSGGILCTDKGAMGIIKGDSHPFAGCQPRLGYIDTNRLRFIDTDFVVVVETDMGIYEIESPLQRIYGEKLGLVVLKRGEGLYTLRRLDSFMPGDLNDVYRVLNYLDPVVRCRKNSNEWGGSSDIGGSPRGVSTKLTPVEIAQACRAAFHVPKTATHALHFLYALLIVCATAGAAVVSNLFLSSGSWLGDTVLADWVSRPHMPFFLTVIVLSAIAIVFISRARLWQFGLRLPTDKDWWILLPDVVLSAMGNGVYFPHSAFHSLSLGEGILYVFVLVPVASEFLFRGLAYGILAKGTSVQGCVSEWMISYPAVSSAILYAIFITCLIFAPEITNGAFQVESVPETAFAAFAFGLANGVVRERSHSILPAIGFHAIAVSVFVF